MVGPTPAEVLTLSPAGGSPASASVAVIVRVLLWESASAEWVNSGLNVSGVGATLPIL